MPTRKEVITYQSDLIPIGSRYSSHLHMLSNQVPCVILVNLKDGTENTHSSSLPMWILCLDNYLEKTPVKISGNVVLHETHECLYRRVRSTYRRFGFKLDITEYMFRSKIFLFCPEDVPKYSLDFKLILVIETEDPHEASYEGMFEKSEENDTALEIEGRILYVNKKFLSENSDYFRCLFSEVFVDGEKDVIPIGLSTYEEFGMIFSKVWPGNEQKIRDFEVEKLLELAQRYQFKLLTRKVEQHLINYSKFSVSKVLCISEKFQLSDVIEVVLTGITYLDVMANKLFPSYVNLSERTRGRMEEILKYYNAHYQASARWSFNYRNS